MATPGGRFETVNVDGFHLLPWRKNRRKEEKKDKVPKDVYFETK
jgi:hypothetical protein